MIVCEDMPWKVVGFLVKPGYSIWQIPLAQNWDDIIKGIFKCKLFSFALNSNPAKVFLEGESRPKWIPKAAKLKSMNPCRFSRQDNKVSQRYPENARPPCAKRAAPSIENRKP